LLLALAIASASATVPDLFGSGARSMGMGGGGVAVIDDGSATGTNPAGLTGIRRPTLTIGFTGAGSHFDASPALWWDTNRDGRIDASDPPLQYDVNVDDVFGFTLTAGRQVGKRFAIGMSAYVPAQRLLRLETVEPDLPNYFIYGNRLQRYTLDVGVAAKIINGLALGAAIDFVPAARFKIAMTVDATLTGDGQNDDGNLDPVVGDVTVDVHQMGLDIVPGFAPIVGVRADFGKFTPALKGLRFGASFRGKVGLPITVDMDLQANMNVVDVGDLDPFIFSAILGAGLSVFDHYLPARVSVGGAYKIADTLDVYLDVNHTLWKPMIVNVARVTNAEITSPLITLPDGSVHDGNDYDLTLRNVTSVRTGSELHLPKWKINGKAKYVRLRFRGGFQYEPTPLVTQGRSSAFLDANRFGYALGAGIECHDPFDLVDAPLRLDLWGQAHTLAPSSLPRQSDEPKSGFPVEGGTIPVGGKFIAAGIQFGFDYD
jgi:long-subunit fatty acid transport protein